MFEESFRSLRVSFRTLILTSLLISLIIFSSTQTPTLVKEVKLIEKVESIGKYEFLKMIDNKRREVALESLEDVLPKIRAGLIKRIPTFNGNLRLFFQFVTTYPEEINASKLVPDYLLFYRGYYDNTDVKRKIESFYHLERYLRFGYTDNKYIEEYIYKANQETVKGDIWLISSSSRTTKSTTTTSQLYKFADFNRNYGDNKFPFLSDFNDNVVVESAIIFDGNYESKYGGLVIHDDNNGKHSLYFNVICEKKDVTYCPENILPSEQLSLKNHIYQVSGNEQYSGYKQYIEVSDFNAISILGDINNNITWGEVKDKAKEYSYISNESVKLPFGAVINISMLHFIFPLSFSALLGYCIVNLRHLRELLPHKRTIVDTYYPAAILSGSEYVFWGTILILVFCFISPFISPAYRYEDKSTIISLLTFGCDFVCVLIIILFGYELRETRVKLINARK